MRDLGLVHVHGKGVDIGGPVAILLESDSHTHFLGAYINDKNGGKLVLELIPKSAICDNIGWQRSAPYSERLLRQVAMLDCVAGKAWGDTKGEGVPTEQEAEKPTSRKPESQQRVFGKHGATTSYLPLPPIPSSKSRKPGSSPEVAAVKADLNNLMGKYRQIVPENEKEKKD